MMKKYFFTGLIVLLPLAVTIAIFAFLVNFLTKPFIGFVSTILAKFDIINHGIFFFTPEQTLHYGSQILILIFLFFVTVVIGIVTEWLFFKSLLKLGDRILHKIPLVNTVYKTTQDIIKTLFVSNKNSFKQVVMVPFPQQGSYVIGLISRESPQNCSDKVGEPLFSVLVPTTPNPTTGFLLMFKKKDMIFLDLKPEDAIKYIISCGVIIPDYNNPPAPILPPVVS